MKQGFPPDSISTDLHVDSMNAGMKDMLNVISKFLMLGMSIDQVIACATINASHAFPLFRSRGTLKAGATADVAVLELREGTFEFEDNYGNKRTGRQRLFPSATVLAGKRVPPRA